jgi:hypothetical protein
MLFGVEARVILPADMNKVLAQILFLLLILTTGIAFTLALSPSVAVHAHSGLAGRVIADSLDPSSRQSASSRTAATPSPTPQAVSQPGSTDGLVIMSLAIVVIIILPILFQRGLWMK